MRIHFFYRIWDCVDFRDQPVKVQKDAHDLGCTCMDIAPYKANMPNGGEMLCVARPGKPVRSTVKSGVHSASGISHNLRGNS